MLRLLLTAAALALASDAATAGIRDRIQARREARQVAAVRQPAPAACAPAPSTVPAPQATAGGFANGACSAGTTQTRGLFRR